MSESNWTEQHSRLIAEAAPPVPAPTTAEMDEVWTRLQPEGDVVRLRRRRRIRMAIGAAALAASLTIGGVAAASVFTAHTGDYPSDADDLRWGGPGERLDPGAADFGDVLAEITVDIPFPSDHDRALVLRALVADGERSEPGTARASTGALRAWAAQGAVCAWANQWASGTTTGDAQRRAAATEQLAQAARWPAVTDIDPVQKHSSQKITARDVDTGEELSGTADDSTQFAFVPDVSRAAQGTDVGRMDALLEQVHCYGAPTEYLPLTHASNNP